MLDLPPYALEERTRPGHCGIRGDASCNLDAVVGTIRLVGSNANNAFSSVASTIQ